jgi:ethanolamine utilization protein EutN
LAGWKLLLVQLLAPDGKSPDGEPILAIDRLGAGKQDLVVVTNDGKATREMIGSDNTPVRWSVLGIKDS